MTVLLSAVFLVPCIGVLRWLKIGSMFNRKILLVVSAIYVVFSVLAYVSYETEMEDFMFRLPPEARPYVGAGEIVPFSAQLGVILADGILLGVCWILTLKPNQKKQLA